MSRIPHYTAALFADEAMTIELTPIVLDGVISDEEAVLKVHDFAPRWMKANGVDVAVFQISVDGRGLGPKLVGNWDAERS